ncbi:MAG: type II toxin-antitoxin system RelE/ParE family toxin [Bacteroidetes bacterium]|nr:MAG: type II toxin-antitoxin system RelE/ParE family toxin [Bacteroidota bacterium]
MAKEVVWSRQADKKFDQIIAYLRKDWSDKEVVSFVRSTYRIIELLEMGNIAFRSSSKRGIREVLITKHNLLIYRESEDRIELVTFYDTRQHPKKKFFT